MQFKELRLAGAYVIDTEKREDERGFFGRIWCEKEFKDHGLASGILQTNVGFSPKKATLRGLHFQLPPYDEVKILRCTRGAVFDVIVDLRHESPTFKQWLGVQLTQDNYRMLYVPKGFAQGYITLTANTEVYYHTTQFYSPEHARGVRYDDPSFKIELPIQVEMISKSDKSWPDYED